MQKVNFSFPPLCHALLVIFHIKLFFKLFFCHSGSSGCWQFVLPLLSRVSVAPFCSPWLQGGIGAADVCAALAAHHRSTAPQPLVCGRVVRAANCLGRWEPPCPLPDSSAFSLTGRSGWQRTHLPCFCTLKSNHRRGI